MQCVSPQKEKDNEEQGPYRVKVVAVGDWKSDKTHLLLTLTEQTPITTCTDLIYTFKKISVENVKGKQLEITFFNQDTREDFDQLRPLLYPNTDLVLVCYSIAVPDTILSLPDIWVPEIRQNLPKVPLLMVGCWPELRDDPKTLQKLEERLQAPVSIAEAKEIAEEIGAVAYLECSPKTANGMKELLDTISNEYVRHREIMEEKQKKNFCVLL